MFKYIPKLLLLFILITFPSFLHAEIARPVSDFLNSICVNTKLGQGSPYAKVSAALQYTGIKCIREGAYDAQKLIDLHSAFGIKVDVLIGPNPTIPTRIDYLKQLIPSGTLLAVEGPNEPNNFGWVYEGESCGKGTTSWMCIARFARDFMIAWDSDPITRDYPFIGVSEVGAEGDNVGLQWNKIPSTAPFGVIMPGGTLYADIANDHSYTCCYDLDKTTMTLKRDNPAWMASALHHFPPYNSFFKQHNETWRRKYLGYVRSQNRNIPKTTTETGWWSDDTEAGNALQARMIGPIYLSSFMNSRQWTFVYQLIDMPFEFGWGLYTGGPNGAPRPAATVIHNITNWLADVDTPFISSSANVSLVNPPGPNPSPIHAFLLQKSTGQFEYMTWGEKKSGSVNQVVDLGQTYANVRVYDPVTNLIEFEGFASSVTLELSLGPKIVEFYN